eukprot:NODE_25_length_35605_cov_0.353461.p21 type:complete len:107 gc:universal NODE_25_length_35605_cov_0.353461:31827-32147(+)
MLYCIGTPLICNSSKTRCSSNSFSSFTCCNTNSTDGKSYNGATFISLVNASNISICCNTFLYVLVHIISNLLSFGGCFFRSTSNVCKTELEKRGPMLTHSTLVMYT